MSKTPDHWVEGVREAAKWPLFVGVALILVGLLLIFHLNPSLLVYKVLLAGVTELGFAFVIAWIVSASIEVRSRKKHDREMKDRSVQFEKEIKEREKTLNKNIFDYIYSIKLPKALFLCVEKHIFQSPFIKDYQKIEYNFERWEKGGS